MQVCQSARHADQDPRPSAIPAQPGHELVSESAWIHALVSTSLVQAEAPVHSPRKPAARAPPDMLHPPLYQVCLLTRGFA